MLTVRGGSVSGIGTHGRSQPNQFRRVASTHAVYYLEFSGFSNWRLTLPPRHPHALIHRASWSSLLGGEAVLTICIFQSLQCEAYFRNRPRGAEGRREEEK